MVDPARGAFPLRFKDGRLRELVRQVAALEEVSQTDLIEEAVAHELIFRSARLADDLAAAASRLNRLTESQRAELIDSSLDEFAQGEALPEPLQAKEVHAHVDGHHARSARRAGHLRRCPRLIVARTRVGCR